MHVGVYNRQVVKIILDAVFITVQVALMLGLAAKGYPDFMRGVAVTTLLWLGYAWIEYKYNLYMNNYVRAVVILAVISDGFLGYYLEFYISSVVFDKLLHIFGSYAFALFSFIIIVQWLKTPFPRAIASIFIVSLGVSIGAFYEIAEFAGDTWGNPVLLSQPSLQDTNLDLIANTAGALVAALHCNFTDFIGNRTSN